MTIYVGNLSFQMKDDDLKNTFAEFGNVTSAKVISDKYSGRSKGFGFVEMDNDAAGKAAIEALNGKEVQGRPLRVNEARPKEDNRER
ncbi:MAG: RNA recognition motif domain-containing protein [Bacteroidia bacterium]